MTTIGTTRPNVESILNGLKDFQRDSVEYIFQRLYTDEDRVSRFLVADEVGLGKTLVARGIITKAIDHLWDTIDRIDVIYICSNQDIARQNIDRLNITDEREFQHASRATLLPIKIQKLRSNKLNFVSLTPGTSFNLRSQTGWAWERVVLFNLLSEAWEVPEGILKNVMRGDVIKRNWNGMVQWFKQSETIDRELQESFIKEINTRPDLRKQYDLLADAIGSRRVRIPAEIRWKRNAFTGEIRRMLAHSSLSALEPDLVILDEFQRFKYLLEEDNEFAILARELFDFEDAKILLLSATPYKMYTLHGEADENHYEDFERTAKFLLNGKDQEINILNQAVSNYRQELLRLGTDVISREKLLDAKSTIEQVLRKVMVRTERLAVTADRNGMLREQFFSAKSLNSHDFCSFVYLDKISQQIHSGDQVEYWKSSSYPLNLMENYKVKKDLRIIASKILMLSMIC